MTSFYGVDASLTATGLAGYIDGTWDTATVKTTPADSGPDAFIDRVDDIVAKTLSWIDPHHGDVIALEGPSLQAKGAAVDRMYYLFWAMYRGIREHHGSPWVVPPSALKKLATGKGNASKDEVLLSAARRLADAPVQSNNEADAAWLAVAASYQAGRPFITLPQTHLTGIFRGAE